MTNDASPPKPAADSTGCDDEEEGRTFGGEQEWHFRNKTLTVRSFEDFVDVAIGGVVTRASADLTRWAAEVCPDGYWKGRSSVELGSGCALVSSALLKMGARVCATDLEQLLEHISYNLSLNAAPSSEEYQTFSLDWGDAGSRMALRERLGPGGADAIFAANCVYAHDTAVPFLATVKALSGPETLALMCGVPVPPAGKNDEGCLIDTFLAAAPDFFDCHLIEVPGGLEKAGRADKDGNAVYPDGLATSLASSKEGLTAGALADGIWLLKMPGAPVPSWLTPMLSLQARTSSDASCS
eukprot:TRINITY_DN39563_c0_g1_i1.p1 TRINITY_DN39563_c0_g1~~TRINITY_DN39563_c0_g1_i1.p1  ORF type:complete len:314 (+),score=65.93 TRINITY_DN39563_c0_g1_i1:53-943(+)